MEDKLSHDEFEQMSDEKLLQRIHDKDQDALDHLMKRYKRLVEKKTKSYFLIGASKEDIIQEGMIGLFKAIQDYDESREAAFFSFAELCITRQIISAVKASTRKKHMPLNSYVSLNKSSNQDEESSGELIESVLPDRMTDPERLLIDQENFQAIKTKLDNRLSRFEKQVIQLYIDGVNYKEIADILKKSPKSIDNALQRVKKKMEKAIEAKNE